LIYKRLNSLTRVLQTPRWELARGQAQGTSAAKNTRSDELAGTVFLYFRWTKCASDGLFLQILPPPAGWTTWRQQSPAPRGQARPKDAPQQQLGLCCSCLCLCIWSCSRALGFVSGWGITQRTQQQLPAQEQGEHEQGEHEQGEQEQGDLVRRLSSTPALATSN
jgi:hypothetical protein